MEPLKGDLYGQVYVLKRPLWQQGREKMNLRGTNPDSQRRQGDSGEMTQASTIADVTRPERSEDLRFVDFFSLFF